MNKKFCLALACLAAVGCGSDDGNFNQVVLNPAATVTTSATTTTRNTTTSTTTTRANPDVAGVNGSGVRNAGATNAASNDSSPDEPSQLNKGLVELSQADYDEAIDEIEPDLFSFSGSLRARLTSLPSSASVTLVPPVADQGQTGSCAAHAGYVLGGQSFARTTNVEPTTTTQFPSRAWLYRKTLALENADGQIVDPSDNELKGTQIINYLKQFVNEGSPTEAEVDYPSVQLLMPQMETAIQAVDYTSPRTLTFVAGSYALIKQTDQARALDQIKRNLATNHPVGFGAKLTGSFNNYSSGVYTASDAFTPGGHAMVLVGYDDTMAYTNPQGQAATGAFRVQNSWNPTGWGQAGYAWVSYEAFFRSTMDDSPEYYVLDPVLTVTQETSGGALTGANGSDGAVLQARQVTEDDNSILLVFSTTFASAHNLQRIELVQPNGTTATQTLPGNVFRSGHLQFARTDGNQFPAGSYTVRFVHSTGTSQATVTVDALANSTLPASPLNGQGEQGADGQPITVQ